MESKILKTYTLEDIEEVINHYIEEEILQKGKVDLLEKWNYFSLVALEKDEVIDKFLEGCRYIDELSLEKYDKIREILTLAYLTVKEKMPIVKMDINNIYLLVSYLQDVDKKHIKASLKYLNNKDLLFAIRFKSLDLSVRCSIIKYVDTLKKDINEAITLIKDTEYYELVKLVS